MQSAAKVGLLVVVFVALLFGAYAVLGRTMFAPKRATYYALFDDATGVAPATQVLMAGVKVGAVRKVELAGPTQAKVTFEVDEGVRIPIGSTASIPTPLIGLGETPITIEPPLQPAGTLAPGATLVGRKAGALDKILPDSTKTVEELNRTLVAVRKLLEDQRLKDRADKLLASSEKTIAEFGELARTTNGLLAQNQAAIARALQSADATLREVHQVTRQVSAMLADGRIQRDTKAIVADMRQVAANANDLVRSMNALVNDPQLRQPLAGTAANVEKITATGTQIAENTRQITEHGIEISKNTAELTAKAVPVMDKAHEVLQKATEIEDQLKGVLDRVGGFFTRRPGPGPLADVGLSMDLMRETEPGYWRTDLGLTLPISDGTLHAGIYDAFGSNKLTLQIGKPAGPNLAYRYGIYAAKPSVGVDFRLAPRLTLRGDVWDINRLRVDLRARYDFGNGLVGWLGFDRILDRNAPTIGIGLRR